MLFYFKFPLVTCTTIKIKNNLVRNNFSFNKNHIGTSFCNFKCLNTNSNDILEYILVLSNLIFNYQFLTINSIIIPIEAIEKSVRK